MDNRRLIIATVISAILLFAWQILFPENNAIVKNSDQQQVSAVESGSAEMKHESIDISTPEVEVAAQEVVKTQNDRTATVKIENKRLSGSINLKGARIDDVYLKDYKKSIQKDSENVKLLSAESKKDLYMIVMGMLRGASGNGECEMPGPDTIWNSDGDTLLPGKDIKLWWKNAQGLEFIINLSIDEDYMINVAHSVKNSAGKAYVVNPYISVKRSRLEDANKGISVHEGALISANNRVTEKSFKDLGKKDIRYGSELSWFGFVDKYWLVALSPEKKHNFDVKIMNYQSKEKYEMYQSDLVGQAVEVMPGESAELLRSNVFVGAKVLSLLEKYRAEKDMLLFDKAVDFGIFYFITKPLFLLLQYLFRYSGNFGIALILLTVITKVTLFPLAYKGLRSMKKLRDLNPAIAEIKEKYKNNAQMQQQKIMETYKRDGVNPLSGCLPVILQMPVFFAVYKVLCVTIEMRQAPFFGWLKDLSAQDSTTIFNLFGLLDWTPPSMLMIGVLPILMSLTMFFQQKMSPRPTDESQALVINALPFVFLIMFSSFPSGLLLYWTCSNMLSILQQYTTECIMNCGRSKK